MQRPGGELADLPGELDSGRAAPTSAKVSQRWASSWLVALSAISNAPNTRRRMVSASAIDFIPGANIANSSCPKYDCCTPAATIR